MLSANGHDFVILEENKPQNEKITDNLENQDTIKKSDHKDCENPDCEIDEFMIAKIHLSPQNSPKTPSSHHKISSKQGKTQSSLHKMSKKQGKTPSSLHKINFKKRIRDENDENEEDFITVHLSPQNSPKTPSSHHKISSKQGKTP